jgi:hypothetical protein
MTRTGKAWWLLWGLSFLLCPAGVATAGPSGRLSALVLDETGAPISNVVLSLLNQTVGAALPTLTRTNDEGRVLVTGLAAGTYQVAVKSSTYRSPVSRLVEVLPDRTAVITLVLQQFLAVPQGGDNVGLKALLRFPDQRRLIFRGLPADAGEEGDRRLFEEAVVQVYTNGGVGGDYFVFPGDAWGGTTTNFAALVERFGSSEQIVAGQLNSGEDSVWRVKNVFKYDAGDSHTVRLFMGYGRVSFEQPRLALLNDPSELSADREFATAPGTSHLMNVGFSDSFRLGPTMTLTWGVELDRVKTPRAVDVFVSPNAELRFQPAERTEVRLLMASRRATLGNTVTLPDGERISLNSPAYLATIGRETYVGTSRHYLGSVTHHLTADTALEVAFFENRPFGASMPLVAVSEVGPGAEVLRLSEDHARSEGARMTVRQQVADNLLAEIAVVRAAGPGLADMERLDPAELDRSTVRRHYHAVSGRLDAYIPGSRTQLTALVNIVAGGKPLVTLDPMADVMEAGNAGINLFIRQAIPLPEDLLRFLGLDFLAPERVEALLDVRNLLDRNLGTARTPSGDVILVQNPRSIRGGVSFRF